MLPVIKSRFLCSRPTKKLQVLTQDGVSGVFTVNFEQISHIVLVFSLLALKKLLKLLQKLIFTPSRRLLVRSEQW